MTLRCFVDGGGGEVTYGGLVYHVTSPTWEAVPQGLAPEDPTYFEVSRDLALHVTLKAGGQYMERDVEVRPSLPKPPVAPEPFSNPVFVRSKAGDKVTKKK